MIIHRDMVKLEKLLKLITKDDILQPYISENDFRSSIDVNDIGYNMYAIEIRYQKIFQSSKPMKVEFKFDGVIPAGIYGNALVLTKILVSINSDGQRKFDLT